MKQQKKLTKSRNIIQKTVGGDAHCEDFTLKNVGAGLVPARAHGITLISLVITIVIMLILAGVAISITVAPEGLFRQAEKAKTDWDAQIAEEQSEFDKALGYLGIDPPTEISDQMPAGKGWDNSATGPVDKVASQGKRTVPIPKGYTVSQIPGEDSISGGLVIYQTDAGQAAVTGEAHSAEHIAAMETRNQYVWIPVDDINDMVMCKHNNITEGSYEENGETITTKTCKLEYDITSNHITCKTHGYDTSTPLTTSNINTTGLAGRLYGGRSTSLKETTADGQKIYQTNKTFTQELKNAQKFVANSTYEDSYYREPDLATYYDANDASTGKTYMAVAGISDGTASSFKAQLNADFIEMAKSVAKYGGFYIARYEVGYDKTNSKVLSKKNQKVLTSFASEPWESAKFIDRKYMVWII